MNIFIIAIMYNTITVVMTRISNSVSPALNSSMSIVAAIARLISVAHIVMNKNDSG